MRFSLFLLGLLTLLGAGHAVAEDQVPRRLQGDSYSTAAYALAQATHVVRLVRSERTITLDRQPYGKRPSDLRVSLVVLESGSPMDVSPTQHIHIAMFNDVIEHGIAWAIEPVASVFGFERAERTAPGIYEVFVTTLHGDGMQEDCPFARTRITIDARQLSIAVRHASGLDEFEIKRYSVPISTRRKFLGCGNL